MSVIVWSLVRNVLWNGMLALIPVALAYAIVWVGRPRAKNPIRAMVIAGLVIAWLVFLPNTCYLLTEWRHFLEVLDANDLFLRSQTDNLVLVQLSAWWLFYFLYSGFGMLTFTLAIRPVERLAAKRGASTRFWALPFFAALSLGVYFGLVMRFNSWNIVSHPRLIWAALGEISTRPRLVIFIVGFGGFLWISYEAVNVWIDGLAERWTRATGRRMHLGPKPE